MIVDVVLCQGKREKNAVSVLHVLPIDTNVGKQVTSFIKILANPMLHELSKIVTAESLLSCNFTTLLRGLDYCCGNVGKAFFVGAVPHEESDWKTSFDIVKSIRGDNEEALQCWLENISEALEVHALDDFQLCKAADNAPGDFTVDAR